MAKGSLPRSAKKTNQRRFRQKKEKGKEPVKQCDCLKCLRGCKLAGLEDNRNGFRMIPSNRRDGSVTVRHLRCGTLKKVLVDNEAYERGIVLTRCFGCDDTLPIADVAQWFRETKLEIVERVLFDENQVTGTLPDPRAPDFAICSTFGPPDLSSPSSQTVSAGVIATKELTAYFDDLESNLEEQSEMDGGSTDCECSSCREACEQPGTKEGSDPKKNEKVEKRTTHCDCSYCKKACELAGLKDTTNGFSLIPTKHFDYKVEFTHGPCRTEIKRIVSKEALDRGVVVVRCPKCNDLIPVADPANWFGGLTHEIVKRKLFGFFRANVLPKGSKFSFCAIFGGPDGHISGEKKTHSLYDVDLVPTRRRDTTVDFTHVPCQTQITTMVDRQALDRGVVMVRCSGCDDLVTVAFHGDLFNEDTRDKVELFLNDFRMVLPPIGSLISFCATFERPDSVNRDRPGGGGKKDPLNDIDYVTVPICEHNATVDFIHPRCRTQITRLVNQEALDNGIVVVRCNGCGDFVPVADHTYLFGDGSHDMVESYLRRLRGAHVPAKGSDSSFCAIFKSSFSLRETVQVSREVADSTASVFGRAADLNNPNAKGNAVVQIKRERDHEVAYTHPACNTKQVRKVCHEALERGAVVGRCTGCNQLFYLADTVGWFGRLQHPSTLESFLSNFMGDIKHGSEETFCVTYESMEVWHHRKQGEE